MHQADPLRRLTYLVFGFDIVHKRSMYLAHRERNLSGRPGFLFEVNHGRESGEAEGDREWSRRSGAGRLG
jgi:hypothetical protein